MSDNAIVYDQPAPYVSRITLNRPERLNAYNKEMCSDLVRALAHYLEDDSQRCLLLTGAGRAFCSGGDMREFDPESMGHGTRQMSHANDLKTTIHLVIRTLLNLDKPVIAVINGAAVAGGLALALACDFRIAASTAKLGDTSGRFGLLPDEGGAWLFPRFMGYDRALKMTLFHETYAAEEALRLGLVTEVVDESALESRSLAFAAALAEKAPLAVRLAKTMMRHGLTSSLEHALDEAAVSVMITNSSGDVREGTKAFFEKRKPKFTGW